MTRGLSNAAFVCLLGATLFAASLPRGTESVIAATRPERVRAIPTDVSATRPPWCGVLVPGSRRIVEGHVSCGACEADDAFAFTTGGPCNVRVRALASLPGTDLDVAFVDPTLAAPAQRAEFREVAFPAAGADIELLVRSAWGSSAYVLEIEVVPYAPPSRPAAPEFVSDPAP